MLARNGPTMAARTGLGHVWVGAVLVAGATSPPKLTTGSAAVIRDAPSLATGDPFSSSVANTVEKVDKR